MPPLHIFLSVLKLTLFASNQLLKSILLLTIGILITPVSVIATPANSTQNYFKIMLTPSSVKQGESFTIFVDSVQTLKSLKLKGLDQDLPVYRIWHDDHDHLFRSFIGVPATKKPGSYKIVAEAVDINGESLRIYQTLRVQKANFKVQHINLPKRKVRLLNVEQLRKEGRLLGSRLRLKNKRVYFANHFIRPAEGRISSLFGVRRKYNDEAFSSYHKGIDIANVTGTPVKASNGGRVSLAESMKSNGKIVLINHGHGITTIYSHLNIIKVKEGQWVKQGQIIGLIGSTGISSGPHLHFGFSVNNVRVDPEQWLSKTVTIFYNSPD